MSTHLSVLVRVIGATGNTWPAWAPTLVKVEFSILSNRHWILIHKASISKLRFKSSVTSIWES